jgi:16S rRNA (adenine1518-N6/adenine1519-N6)-dimethyltransferase
MRRSPKPKKGFHPSRAKGQSFLRDPAFIQRIVAAVNPGADEAVVEIGAGAGEMTIPLAKASQGRILAVEPEPFLAEKLHRKIEDDEITGVEVIYKDYLSLDLPSLLDARELERVRVVGNLPYSVASPILAKLLSERHRLVDLTLMFQQEVADRLVAEPGTKAYGVLSVLVQQATKPRVLFQLPPKAFWPRPRVHSALVRMAFLRENEPPVADRAVFQALVKALFSHRRKNISNNIKYLNTPLLNRETIRSALAQLQIDPNRRAETLSVEEFAALAHFCASRQ